MLVYRTSDGHDIVWGRLRHAEARVGGSTGAMVEHTSADGTVVYSVWTLGRGRNGYVGSFRLVCPD